MIDTHCHLDMCEEGSRGHGLVRVATVGIDDAAVGRALEFADAHDEVYAIVGRHPNSAEGFAPSDLEPIGRAAAHPKAVAIGETGLDYYRDYAPHDDQQRAFEAQIELAREVGKPLVIHTRAAEDDTFDVLAERAGGVTVVMHCFSAADRLDDCIERGYMCSFAGNVTYPKATDLQEAAARVPDELLLVETDSPFLSPQPVRGKPNAPANVVHTAREARRAARRRVRGARAARRAQRRARLRLVSGQGSIRRLREFDVRPNRELGQNFLVDDNILRLVADAAELSRRRTWCSRSAAASVCCPSIWRRSCATSTSSRWTARWRRRCATRSGRSTTSTSTSRTPSRSTWRPATRARRRWWRTCRTASRRRSS